ncbi:hypothetical protein PGO_021620 [Plasmodium gonderi]|uniref:RAD protein n=1 Tax=Plasmodium gonderi TaxID=77519 RepID=A0A1Y1JA95_PLAGO|nr:hypothetical protein PGO_021620 [Plasmodium gonderi]GAW79190.1 hypothetical protein PGO_021620 [Plasmodium gonderi]
MMIWRIFLIFLFVLAHSSFVLYASTNDKTIWGLPISEEKVNKILSINHIENFNDYLKFIKFKYEMIGIANNRLRNISNEEAQILLNSKDALVEVLKGNADRNELKLPYEDLQDVAQYILNELIKKNEMKKIEQIVFDEKCDSYRDEYYEYRDRQFKEAFENAHSNWANNELTKNFDPQWKKMKWNLWVDYFNDILYTLKLKDYMLHNSILHLKTISSVCKQLYDTLKASLIKTYTKPFVFEYNKFLHSSIEEWKHNNQKNSSEKAKLVKKT